MNIALILAGGSGKRVLNSALPKQFIIIKGKSILAHTICQFDNVEEIDEIFVVTSKEYFAVTQESINKEKFTKKITLVVGGNSRQLSSYSGITEIAKIAKKSDNVLIHDAARPLVKAKTIRENISALSTSDAVATGRKVVDTIKKVHNGIILNEEIVRDELYALQTPQSFKLGLIYDAHKKAEVESFFGTDDASLICFLGEKVQIIEGDLSNIKVTTADDLEVVEQLIGI